MCCLLRTYKLCCIARKNFQEGRVLFKNCYGSNTSSIKHLNQSHSKLGHTSKELDLVPACWVETETFNNGLNQILKKYFHICVIAFPRYIASGWAKKIGAVQKGHHHFSGFLTPPSPMSFTELNNLFSLIFPFPL